MRVALALSKLSRRCVHETTPFSWHACSVAGPFAGAEAADSRKGPLLAQEGPAVADPVEKMIAPDSPTIALNHLGFRPKVGSKVLVVRVAHTPLPR